MTGMFEQGQGEAAQNIRGFLTMTMAASARKFLQESGISFRQHNHLYQPNLMTVVEEIGIVSHHVAIPYLLKSEKNGLMMAIIPLNRALDLERINALLRREFNYATETDLARWFQDVESGAYPPLAGAYRIPFIVDRELLKVPMVFFRGGTHSSLVSISGADFRFLCAAAPKAVISNMKPARSEEIVAIEATEDAIKQSLEKIHRLPPMPPMAYKIIEMVGDADTTAEDLASVVELDPSIAAQVVRYACSPYFGYRGSIDSVQDAIARVLGFDLVSNIALGIASSQAFNVTREGPLGLEAFWRHSLYCAILSQMIARKTQNTNAVNPAKAYLCGLLHNLGVLLLGHLFPPEFKLLNKMAEKHPQNALRDIEKRVMGLGKAQQLFALGHAQIGAWLLERWHLPEEVVACCAQHNNQVADGEYQTYISIVQASNQLLAREGIGDGALYLEYDPILSGQGLQSIGLSDVELNALFVEVMAMCGEIDELAAQIAA